MFIDGITRSEVLRASAYLCLHRFLNQRALFFGQKRRASSFMLTALALPWSAMPPDPERALMTSWMDVTQPSSRLEPSAHRPRVAACITGELRTFAMPFVHLNLLRHLKSWGADSYFVHSPHPGSGRLSFDGNEVWRCEDNQTAMDLFRPKGVSVWGEDTALSGVARIQLGQWKQCFQMVQESGVPYDIFLRLRPDMVVMNDEVPALPTVEELRSATIYQTFPKADFLWVMAMQKAPDWFARAEETVPETSCCVEITPAFHEDGASCEGGEYCECTGWCRFLDMKTGLVRNPSFVQDWSTNADGSIRHPEAKTRDRTAEEMLQSTCKRVGVYEKGLCARRSLRKAEGETAHPAEVRCQPPSEVTGPG